MGVGSGETDRESRRGTTGDNEPSLGDPASGNAEWKLSTPRTDQGGEGGGGKLRGRRGREKMSGRESLQQASRTLHDRLEVTHSNQFRHSEPHQSVEKPKSRGWWNVDGVLMTVVVVRK
jgi:hypothetical protein